MDGFNVQESPSPLWPPSFLGARFVFGSCNNLAVSLVCLSSFHLDSYYQSITTLITLRSKQMAQIPKGT